MANNITAIRPDKSRSQTHLVRGIDEIPECYEFLSAHSAMRECNRAASTLRRLADTAASRGRHRDASALRRCATAAEQAESYISGGFDVGRMEKLVARYPSLAKAAGRAS